MKLEAFEYTREHLNKIHYGAVDALENDMKLFRKIDLTPCKEATSLRDVQVTPAVLEIQRLFGSAGLDAKVGFSQTTGDVSITFTPPSASLAPPPSKDGLLIWIMFALFHCQEELEKIHAEWERKRGSSVGLNLVTIKGDSANGLANSVLRLFAIQTGCAVAKKESSVRKGRNGETVASVRILFCTSREQMRDPKNLMFRYSPNYYRLLWERSEIDKEIVGIKWNGELVKEVIEMFWNRMESKHRYLAHDTLKQCLTEALAGYLESGIKGETNTFLPAKTCKPLSLYLHGTAGIGKSSFVRAFTNALQDIMQEYVNTNIEVRQVKVPLNSTQPAQLRAILSVRGISDMSIERVVEQALCKGHIVILHMEETPEDVELLDQLEACISEMITTLTNRYGEFKSNIIKIYTSNYPPSESLLKNKTTILPLTVPTADRQKGWCKRVVEDMIKERLKEKMEVKDVEVEFEISPPETEDMRPLEQWCLSLSYQISRQILSSATGSLVLEKPIGIRVAGVRSKLCISISDNNNLLNVEPLEVLSDNGFFYHSQSTNTLAQSLGHADVLSLSEQYRLSTIAEMSLTEYLKPAVIVLTGTEEAKSRVCDHIISIMQKQIQRFGKSEESQVVIEYVEIKKDSDNEKVFGKSNQIMGGLFQVIDNINNPNTVGGSKGDSGVIIAKVNELGQFMLRELLECGNSKTHRQMVKKNRVLFVVSVNEGCDVTPQLSSRAHDIITL